MRDNKWTTSLDGEIFNGEDFDTKEEAVKATVKDLDAEDLKKGFWVGQLAQCHTSQFIDSESLIEDARCQAEDKAGEVAEDYLEDLTTVQKEELDKLLQKWFDDHGFAPNFYSVKNIEKITV